MSAPVPSPARIDTREATAQQPVAIGIVEAGIVEIRYADYRTTLAEVFVVSCAFLIGYVVPHVMDPPQPAMGVWFAILSSIWAFNVIWTLLRFRKAGPAITLDGDGLHSTPWAGKRVDVRWDDIAWCDEFHRGGKSKRPYLGLRLKHPEQRIASRDMPSDPRGPHLWILSEGLQLSTKDLVACIRDYQARVVR